MENVEENTEFDVLNIRDEVGKLPSAIGWKLLKAWGTQEEARQTG